MITHNNELHKLLNKLLKDKKIETDLFGFPLKVSIFDETKLSLSTVVFHGGNYIPKSIRNCLHKKEGPFLDSRIRTSLSIDEFQYLIKLNYFGKMDDMDFKELGDLLEEFCWIAEEWREFLDEHGRHDLVHVFHK